MMEKRIAELEKQIPGSPEDHIVLLCERWYDALYGGKINEAELLRKAAEPIFDEHPELKTLKPNRINDMRGLYCEWQCFVGYLHRRQLTEAFEKWKTAPDHEKQKMAEQANELYLKFTGEGIPYNPIFGDSRAPWKEYYQFWITGTRYEEQLEAYKKEYRRKKAERTRELNRRFRSESQKEKEPKA